MSRAALLACAALCACSPTAADLASWETRDERGPEKLGALVANRSAKPELRRDAALALTRATRARREVGLDVLASRLSAMPDAERTRVVDAMAPELVRVTGLARAPVGKDPSFSGKDAAYLLLSRDLASSAATKDALRGALHAWIAASTVERLDDRAQRFSMQQAMRWLGPDAVRGLPAVLATDNAPLAPLAALVEELGDAQTKTAACEALAALDAKIVTPAWHASARQLIQEADAKSRVDMRPTQVDGQVVAYEEAERVRVFAAITKLGAPKCAERAIAVASEGAPSRKIATSALASLEGHAAELTPADLDALASIARDTRRDDWVRAAAVTRLVETRDSRRLYALFDGAGWRVRFEAATAILATAGASDVPEFMARLPDKGPFALAEAIYYGAAIAKIEGGTAALSAYLAPASGKANGESTGVLPARRLPDRLVALGSFFRRSTAERPTVAALEGDRQVVPRCAPSESCGWQCGADGRIGLPSKEVATVGDFIRFCIEPSLGNPKAPLPPGPLERGPPIMVEYVIPPTRPPPDTLPRSRVELSLPSSDAVPDAARVLAAFRARVRSCYTRGLASDPDQHGQLVLVVVVDPSGEVASSMVAKNSGLSPGVAACVAAGMRRLVFAEGKGGRLEVPITFALEK